MNNNNTKDSSKTVSDNYSNTIRAGIILALLAYAIVTLGDAIVKKALEIDALLIVAFYTNIFSFLVLFIVAPFSGGFKAMIRTKSLKLQVLRALFFVGVYLNFLYAISNMTMAQTYTLYLTQPFILAGIAHFFTQERIGLHRMISIILSFIGVLIVLRPGYMPIELAAICALSCAVFFACGNITAKFMNKDDSWMSYVFYVMLIQTPFLGVLIFFFHEPSEYVPSMESLPFMALAGLFYTFALGLFPKAMQKIDAALYGALEYTALVWGTLYGYFLFAEVPDDWTIAGALVIVVSGLYLVYRERKAGHGIKELES